ncbi:MAG TPA: hypothetical protein ENI61_05380 [Ignavibacteria bacterium]|nr:hypothetical protein [Ignavibacteria bacterium]
MSKIDDLISKSQEITFRGEKFVLKSGFTVEEIPAIQMAFGQEDQTVRAEGMKKLVKVIVKRIYPEASESQISKIDAKYLPDLLEVFFQLDSSTKKDKVEVKEILDKK